MKIPLFLAGCCLSAALAQAAFTPGSAAFTKRVETALLSEPKMTASPVARLPYAKEVRIEAVEGGWVRVKSGRTSGWVFAGNLAAKKPSETRGLDGLPLAAAATDATAAARPLAPAAVDYADRKGLSEAANDLQWLEQQSDEVTAEDVQAFLEREQKGEYQ